MTNAELNGTTTKDPVRIEFENRGWGLLILVAAEVSKLLQDLAEFKGPFALAPASWSAAALCRFPIVATVSFGSGAALAPAMEPWRWCRRFSR